MLTPETTELDFTPVDIMSLDLEYRLTIAMHIAAGFDCTCAEYLIRRKDVLIPGILERAKREKEDPIHIFSRFAKNLHAKYEEEKNLADSS